MLGNYDLEVYSRARVLYNGLKENNIEVDVFTSKSYSKITERLLKRNFDFLIVTGKAPLFISWLLKLIHRKKIIFDVFISDYENLVKDRKIIKENSLKAKFLWQIDKLACKISDHNVLDTQEHINYFCKEFKLNAKKFTRIFVGANEDYFYPVKNKTRNEFIVHFHGTFIPLQGIEHIIQAAKILEKERIKFRIIGTGQTHDEMVKLSKSLNLSNIEFNNSFVSLMKLGEYCSNADICLGIFGNTEKALRVIPNKVFEILACAKPLITEESPAIKELLKNEKECLFCNPADPKSLAVNIIKLKKNKKLREKISIAGNKLFMEKLSANKLAASWIESIIKER